MVPTYFKPSRLTCFTYVFNAVFLMMPLPAPIQVSVANNIIIEAVRVAEIHVLFSGLFEVCTVLFTKGKFGQGKCWNTTVQNWKSTRIPATLTTPVKYIATDIWIGYEVLKI